VMLSAVSGLIAAAADVDEHDGVARR